MAPINDGPLYWDPAPNAKFSPPMVYHAGAIVGNNFYIHGGLEKPFDKEPKNWFFRFNLSTLQCEELTNEGSPYLSQHVAVSIKNRYLALIGGWDGRERTSAVYLFDCESLKWLRPPTTVGYPDGAGLSAHTVNSLGSSGLLILGREGGLRTQRKSGNSYILSGDLSSCKRVTYSPALVSVASRSYHSSTALPGQSLYVVGGRADHLIERHRVSGLHPDPGSPVIDSLLKRAQRGVDSARKIGLLPLNEAPGLKFQSHPVPGGRKGHCVIPGDSEPGFLIWGGETFTGRDKEPVCNGWLYLAKEAQFYWVNSLGHGRSCGVLAVDPSTKNVWYHGGLGPKNAACNDLMLLKLS